MEKEKIINVMKRYELKYTLNKEQLEFFKEEISKYMKIDKYGLTSIASLYFDTDENYLVNRSIEKPKYKEKIRLRSYGLAKEDSPVFLEIKRKLEGIVYKRRVVTTESDVDLFLRNEKELGSDQISRELEAFKTQYGSLEPKYLIIYDRIAYYQDNSDLRITLDMNPRYRTSGLDLHTSMEGTPLLKEGEAILEVKIQHSVPLWLVRILTKGKIYQSSFSKVGTAHIKETNSREKEEVLPINLTNKIEKGRLKYGFTI
jgi:hypothetical protein